MKTLKLLLILILTGSLHAIAQDDMPPPPGDRMKKEQKIKALYVAFITESLRFTEGEAQQFWPVHAQYDGEIRQLDRQMPELDKQQSVLNIKKKYQDKFSKILGNTRTDEFFRKDEEFRKKLIDKLQERRDEKGRGPRRPEGKNGPDFRRPGPAPME